MEPFDPAAFNFILLRDFEFPGRLAVYEYQNHLAVDGKKDFLRLNLYLTKDGNYVTIWSGLLEPMGTEFELERGRLATVEKPVDLDFLDAYNEDLFKGYIDSAEAARHIFNALRIGSPGSGYARPQALSGGSDNKLRCDYVGATD